jgi:hypothetical protein
MRLMDTVELIATAFTREGKMVSQRRQTAHLALRPSLDAAKYEVLTRLVLKPGSYNMRFALTSAALGKSGSVFTTVEVPKFGKDRLSLSGLALSVKDALASAPKDILASLLPIVPTTQREFAKTDEVHAFARVYQGGKKALAPVAVTIRIRDSRDAVVYSQDVTVDPTRFGGTRAADLPFDVPVSQLAAGPYLLTVEAALDGKTNVRRTVRFLMR